MTKGVRNSPRKFKAEFKLSTGKKTKTKKTDSNSDSPHSSDV